jgi:hypothetical protein
VPLRQKDFGDPQEFHMNFANFNLTYRMPRPTTDVCAEGRGIRVLIIIISSPDHFYARQQIRETWMYDRVGRAEEFFVLLGKRRAIFSEV